MGLYGPVAAIPSQRKNPGTYTHNPTTQEFKAFFTKKRENQMTQREVDEANRVIDDARKSAQQS